MSSSPRIPAVQRCGTGGSRRACATALVMLLGLYGSPAVAGNEDHESTRSAVSDTPVAGAIRAPLDARNHEGYAVSLLFFNLFGSTGESDQDRETREAMERLTTSLRSLPFNRLVTEQAVIRIRAIPGVAEADYTLYASERPGEIVLVLTATLSSGEEPASDGKMASSGPVFPILHESDRGLLRVQLNGGHGLYDDYNPWFASPATYTSQSPIALDPPGAGNTAWAESWLEYGIAGATQIKSAPVYVYAEGTALTSASVGQDLFRSDSRALTHVEKLYGGLLWADEDKQQAVRLSGGRQNWQLNSGFLFSKFAAGANAGPNPGLYLNPRTTYEMSVLAAVKLGRFEAEYFNVDPAELEDFDSNTRFEGVHVSWVDNASWDLGAAFYRVPESNTVFRSPGGESIPREGQRTWNLRAGLNQLGSGNNWSLLAEFAHQGHSDEEVSAQAWYSQITYTAQDMRWQPSITYRYASFSGDNPATPAREAFDAPLSSGLDEWVQGINFKKVVTNSNLDSHRIRINLVHNTTLNYTIDFFKLSANVPTARGETDYGEEIDFSVRWAISRKLFFLGVAGIAWPGDVIEAQTAGAAKPWATLQASLFWGF